MSIAELAGKRLNYLIGAPSGGQGKWDEVTECPFDSGPAGQGLSIAYGNLLDEEYEKRRYPPYIKQSDTASQYKEGRMDPNGAGFLRSLVDQLERRRREGFRYIELDNPDSYPPRDVIRAITIARALGFEVIAKNPGIISNTAALLYVAHISVVGIIVERDCGTPDGMNALRQRAHKPDMQVWFVSFGRGRPWAERTAKLAKGLRNMSVSYSTSGEYVNSISVEG